MKKQFVLLFSVLILHSISFGQKFLEPSEGKALVYFTRTNSWGYAINFRLFDSEKYIGKFKGNQYIVYECEPGIHSFWALAENMSMVYADLEADRVYYIDAVPVMGAFKASVSLAVVHKSNKKFKKQLNQTISRIQVDEKLSFTKEELAEEELELKEKIAKGMRYVKAMNSHDMERPIITPDMFVEIPQELK